MATALSHPRSSTDRAIRIAVMCLLLAALGALTTTAVAWGIALSLTQDRVSAARDAHRKDPPPRRTAILLPGRDRTLLFTSSSTLFGTTSLVANTETVLHYHDGIITIERSFPGKLERIIAREERSPPSPRLVPVLPADSCGEFRLGWPTRALWVTHQFQYRSCEPSSFGIDGVLTIPSGDANARSWSALAMQPGGKRLSIWLPIGVLPLGFTLNTFFYAAAWLIPLFGIRIARRTLRRRRGLCTRCAYDLKGLAPASPCPECGHTPAHAPSLDHLTT